jgi:hypothetical protein
MSTRALTSSGDWTFGAGAGNYLSGNAEVAQNISTRLKMFLNDCFFATDQGLDWFNLLGSKSLTVVALAINANILNAPNNSVTGVIQLYLTLNGTRGFSVAYTVQTVYSQSVLGEFTYDVGTGV